MKVDDYKLLVTIQKEKTIRAAAKALLISQPAISQRLKQIENVWGHQIFLRGHNHVVVTPAGEKIIRFAENTLKQEDQLIEDLSKIGDTIRGKLSLGVSSVVGQYILPNILELFVESYPQVKVGLVTGLSQDLIQSKGDFHIMITRGESVHGMNSKFLFTEKLFLIDKKSKQTKNPRRPLIEFQSESGLHSQVNQWFIENPKWKPTQKIKVDQIETCKQLMIHGIGMAVLPEIAIQDLDSDNYYFHALSVNDRPLKRDTWLCYPEVVKELPQVQAFLDTITNIN